LEAEGRALQHEVRRFGFGFVFLLMGGAVGLAGLALSSYAVYVYLSRLLPYPAAVLVCGLVSLVFAGGFLWVAKRFMERT
jgi:hypothetical protein